MEAFTFLSSLRRSQALMTLLGHRQTYLFEYFTVQDAMVIYNKDMTVWPDNADTAAWYYLAVQEATNSHDFARKTDDLHERWTGMSTAPDWTRYEK